MYFSKRFVVYTHIVYTATVVFSGEVPRRRKTQ